MAERPLFSHAERRLLKSLARHKVRFMIVGLSAAVLQGAPVVTQDIDLWFEDITDPAVRAALHAVGAGYVPPFGWNSPMLAGAGTELFDLVFHMDGLGSFAEEVNHTRQISLGRYRVKVLSLERILASKEAANRAKDRLVIPVLRNVLETLRATGRRSTPSHSGKRSRPSRRTKRD